MRYLTLTVLIAAVALSGLPACTVLSGAADDAGKTAGAIANVGLTALSGAGNVVENAGRDVNGAVRAVTHPFPTTFP